MENLLLDDTIAAISTPIGKSGIGIVRLSGKDAISIAEKIFVTSNGKRLLSVPSHTLQYGWIVDGPQAAGHRPPAKKCFNLQLAACSVQPEIIDEVLLGVMRAPRTYTREDIVEINCHSGIVVLKRILDLVLKRGARMATPGEFTKRAYLSGRIDLAQAEAVLDVVNSQTQDALGAALGQLQGKLSRKIKALRKSLLDILTQLELSIDFSDQDIKPISREELLKKTDKVSQDLQGLLDSADKGTILRQGISCVICGKPNVGKSSLLNALLRRDRAIVTPIPGTTRDALEETIDLFGIPLRLIDTAGIIKARNLAEKEAVRRSRKHLREANLVLLVLDANQRLTSEDLAISRYISHRPAFVVLNKQDLPAKISMDKAEKVLSGREVLRVSALCGTGLDSLEREIADFIWQGKIDSNADILVTNIRHKEALKRAKEFIRRAIKAVKINQSAEIIALEIKEAQRSLSEIIGEIRCEDILQRIFSQFCIGK